VVLYLVCIAASAALWLLLHNLTVFTGALFGGGLSLLNFQALKLIGRRMFGDVKRPRIQYFALIWLKFLLMIGICFITVVYLSEYFNVAAFFVSLSVIVFAVIGATVYAVYHGFTDLTDEEMRKGEEKYIGWDDVDTPAAKVARRGAKKSIFDQL